MAEPGSLDRAARFWSGRPRSEALGRLGGWRRKTCGQAPMPLLYSCCPGEFYRPGTLVAAPRGAPAKMAEPGTASTNQRRKTPKERPEPPESEEPGFVETNHGAFFMA